MFCGILPPYILVSIVQNGTAEERRRALATLIFTERLRGQRRALAALPVITPVGEKRRDVFDAQHKTRLPGKLVREEGNAPSQDVAVDEAYDGAGSTYDFYFEIHERNSIDGKGMRIDSSVHYDTNYDNAFWNGAQMVYGDGDQKLFARFTASLDVIGHELTHGVTAKEANLNYQDQSGALNESFSDVFGSLVKQRFRGETATQADWLIGAELLLPQVQGVALRSMKEPGTAYDDPVLGKDPQPSTMEGYVVTSEDDGGVHINSGIPNRAFYLAALGIDGFAWEKAGRIWYDALTNSLQSGSDFADCADKTIAAASDLFGKNGLEEKAVREAWRAVGVSSSRS